MLMSYISNRCSMTLLLVGSSCLGSDFFFFLKGKSLSAVHSYMHTTWNGALHIKLQVRNLLERVSVAEVCSWPRHSAMCPSSLRMGLSYSRAGSLPSQPLT